MLVCFFGKRGSGKTTSIRGNLKNCKGPVLVLDILGNYNDSEFIHTEKTDEAVLLIKHYAESSKERKKELEKIIVLKPADPDVAIDYVSAALWEAHGGTLVIDEADGFSIANAPCFDQLIRYGRNRGVDLITGTRRPAEISRNITAGANRIFIFQTQEPLDIEYYRKTVLGDRAFELMRMKPYHGILIDYDEKTFVQFRIDEKGTIYKLKSEPQFEDNEASELREGEDEI